MNISAKALTAGFGLTCWALCVVFTGVLAHRRGRLVRSWVATAIFFGIFALLLISVMSPLQRGSANA